MNMRLFVLSLSWAILLLFVNAIVCSFAAKPIHKSSEAAPATWPRFLASEKWPPPQSTEILQSRGLRLHRIWCMQAAYPNIQSFIVDRYDLGWPVPVLRYYRVFDGTPVAAERDLVVWYDGLRLSLGRSREVRIPLIPVLPGAVIMLAALTAILWPVAFGLVSLYRRVFKRTGCMACGYPIDGLLRCPECGHSNESSTT
jgi:hypothetical protein